jgi:hypothetical protein
VVQHEEKIKKDGEVGIRVEVVQRITTLREWVEGMKLPARERGRYNASRAIIPPRTGFLMCLEQGGMQCDFQTW